MVEVQMDYVPLGLTQDHRYALWLRIGKGTPKVDFSFFKGPPPLISKALRELAQREVRFFSPLLFLC